MLQRSKRCFPAAPALSWKNDPQGLENFSCPTPAHCIKNISASPSCKPQISTSSMARDVPVQPQKHYWSTAPNRICPGPAAASVQIQPLVLPHREQGSEGPTSRQFERCQRQRFNAKGNALEKKAFPFINNLYYFTIT